MPRPYKWWFKRKIRSISLSTFCLLPPAYSYGERYANCPLALVKAKVMPQSGGYSHLGCRSLRSRQPLDGNSAYEGERAGYACIQWRDR